MFHAREYSLDGDRLVSVPVAVSGLPTSAGTGIHLVTGLAPTDGSVAVKSVELFAGGGGLALGTANAGLRHKVVIEWDADSCATLRRNHDDGVEHAKDWEIVQGDVRAYDFRRHAGEVEFVSGGPPCQPFSIGGKHRGAGDTRNLFPEAVRAVREIRPQAFLFENVRGLLRANFINYFNYVVMQLRYPTVTPKGDEEWKDHAARLERIHTSGGKADLSYQVIFRVVNAVDYGVPQHRWRVFVAGVRSDLGIEYSFPQPTHFRDALLHDMWVSGDYWDRHEIAKRKRPPMPVSVTRKVAELRSALRLTLGESWRTVRDAIADLPRLVDKGARPLIANHHHNPGARSYAGHTGSPWDEPAKALKAGDHGVPGGENMLRMDDDEVRYFSVRESARLQTFPDEWTFAGSWTESMRQLGNAVPVRLAEVMATPLVAMLAKACRKPIRASG